MTWKSHLYTYRDDGLMVIYAVSENEGGVTPTAEELAAYDEEKNLGYPVVADPNSTVFWRFDNDSGLPSVSLFNRGAVVEIVDGNITESDVLNLL